MVFISFFYFSKRYFFANNGNLVFLKAFKTLFIFFVSSEKYFFVNNGYLVFWKRLRYSLSFSLCNIFNPRLFVVVSFFYFFDFIVNFFRNPLVSKCLLLEYAGFLRRIKYFVFTTFNCFSFCEYSFNFRLFLLLFFYFFRLFIFFEQIWFFEGI